MSDVCYVKIVIFIRIGVVGGWGVNKLCVSIWGGGGANKLGVGIF